MKRGTWANQDWVTPRPRVSRLLESGLQYPLITVIAGPGYGKTTAVADYCRTTERRVIWMRLLQIDNDAQRFWNRFCGAAEAELPELAAALRDIDFPDSLGAFDLFLRTFIRHTEADPGVLLVLDNAEHLGGTAVHHLIDSLIRAELENLCVILISAERQTGKTRIGDGQHFHIGPGELCFTEQETGDLLRSYGFSPDSAQVRQLSERTEGWPLALHLMATLPQQEGRRQFGELPYLQVITELFEQSYYQNYDRQLQRLLVQLTLLPGVRPGLIRQLFSVDLPQALELLAHNTFLSYDYQEELFHFQQMYHSFLAKKQAALEPREVEELQAAAGDWYLEHGFYQEAMHCYWAIRDCERFVRVVLALPRVNCGKEFTNQILDRLEQFPEGACAAQEQVDFCRGFMYLNSARFRSARECFFAVVDRLEPLEERTPEQSALLGDTYAAMIDIAYALNNLDAMDYVVKALPLLPEGTRIRSGDIMVVGNNELVFLPEGGAVSLDAMIEYNTVFAEYAKVLYRGSGRGYSHLFNAEASFLANRPVKAWEYSVKAYHAANAAGMFDIAANALYLQLRMALFQGDGPQAEALLQELVSYVEANAPLKLAELRDCARGLYGLSMNDLSGLPIWLADSRALPSDLPLNVGRDRMVCALCLYQAGRWEQSYATLLELDGVFAERGLWWVRVVTCIVKAACLMQMGDLASATEVFWRAYDMTRKNSITVCFAEFGRITLSLLDSVCAQSPLLFEERWLEAVRAQTVDTIRRQTLMLRRNDLEEHRTSVPHEPLTPRETQVIEYLAMGYTREDIGGLMGISLHGVKKHIAGIYKKLNAVNRVDAVNIAVAHGIVKAGSEQ